jgi:hypothetical protein
MMRICEDCGVQLLNDEFVVCVECEEWAEQARQRLYSQKGRMFYPHLRVTS